MIRQTIGYLILLIIASLMLWAVLNIPEEKPVNNYEIITMTVTAYCPCKECCDNFADGITASGVSVETYPFVAAPKKYAFWTYMTVPGYAEYAVPVLDRGGSIKGNKLDVYFPTHEEAKKWGIQILDVKVWK